MVIEVQTFRLAAGVNETAFLAADALMQTDFMHQQPGLQRRTTARGSDGRWLVVVLWGSSQDAAAASEAAKTDPVAIAFASSLDGLEVKWYASLD